MGADDREALKTSVLGFSFAILIAIFKYSVSYLP